MTLKIAICDDESKEVFRIHEYLQAFQIQHEIDCDVSEYYEPEKLLSEYSHNVSFHIIFLDVEMPGMNGLELAKQIRQCNEKRVQIVFISNYPRYMQDSFEVHPFHYLTKPLVENDFQKVMTQIVKYYEDSNIYKIVIHGEETEELVNIHEILYIEADKSKKGYLTFALPDRTLSGKGNLKDWEHELLPYHFMLCHRGILVNVNYIHFFKGNDIILTNGITLPLSRRQEKELRAIFSKRILTLKK